MADQQLIEGRHRTRSGRLQEKSRASNRVPYLGVQQDVAPRVPHLDHADPSGQTDGAHQFRGR